MSVPEVPLEPNKLEDLIERSKDWAVSHGFVMRTKEHKDKSDVCQISPFTLLPTRFPRRLFQQAIDVQKDTNALYFRAAFDREFIEKSLEEVVKSDQFTGNLLKIYRAVLAEGLAQSLVLQIQRSDYMCHAPDGSLKNCSLKQIEVNSIASSFGPLSSRCTKLHQSNLRELNYIEEEIQQILPENCAATTVSSGLAEAWWAYRNYSSLIIFLIEDLNQNCMDQRHVEYGLGELTDNKAKVVRLTLTQCALRLSLGDDRTLILDHSKEVSVVYFRSGYVPAQYHSQIEWDARLMIERSKAIKSPWIGLQLANTKKIQQTLAEPGMIEHYLEGDTDRANKVRATFAGLWGLEANSVETERLVADACENRMKYVLKPQLEGGGSNVYGDDIPKVLQSINAQDRAAYILMERVEPLRNKNYLIRALYPVNLIETVSELGIYGYLVGDVEQNWIRRNVTGGHVLRTKPSQVDEGGIMAGASVLDSPLLV